MAIFHQICELCGSSLVATLWAGLEQLICDNIETYIKRAVELVSQKQELATIRIQLQKQREQLCSAFGSSLSKNMGFT